MQPSSLSSVEEHPPPTELGAPPLPERTSRTEHSIKPSIDHQSKDPCSSAVSMAEVPSEHPLPSERLCEWSTLIRREAKMYQLPSEKIEEAHAMLAFDSRQGSYSAGGFEIIS